MKTHIRTMSRRQAFTSVAVCAVLAAVVVIVSPAFGVARLAQVIPLWANQSFSSNQHLMTVPIWAGNEVSLSLVPGAGGNACVAMRVTEQATHKPPTDAPPFFANYGLDCALGGSSQPAGRIQTDLSWDAQPSAWRSTPRDGNVALTMLGHVPDGMGITSVELQLGGGTQQLPLKNGYFFAWIRGNTKIDKLPDGGPYFVVALNGGGSEVARVDLQQFIEQSIPRK